MELQLKEIGIKNFLSYKDAKFSDLKSFNVLIGKNSSGKSNLFKIFDFLKERFKTTNFSKNFLFDEINSKAEIYLRFSLSKTLRENIFQKLYRGNYIQKAFIRNETDEGYLKRNEWNDKNTAIQWLIDQGCYSEIYIEIRYSNIIKNIHISQVSTKHKKIGKQILLKATIKDNTNQILVSDITQFNIKGKTIQNFFTDFPSINIGSVHSNLRNFFRNIHIFSNNPVLSHLLPLLKYGFFDAIFLIPAKRIFKRDSDRINITSTILEPNGENLAKFIHMKKVTNQDEWLLEFSHELNEYFPDILTIGQMVDQSDRTYLTFKEKDLDFELRIENIGEGISNITHFLAYIKELKENKILFIEEPELHLHPGLENKLREKFINVSGKIQIFITTHSREFLPKSQDRCSVYLIKKEICQSTVNLIPEENYEEIYRNLDMDLNKYKLQKSLIYNEDFWIKFVLKSMEDNRIETDLWDFKQTLDLWNIKENKELNKSKIKFCQQIASFANNQGGVLIIGISDKIPRKIIGLDYDSLENRVTDLNNLIKRRTRYNENFMKIQQIKLKDKDKIEKICLIIAIAQTMKVIGVLQDDGSYIYKKRIGPSSETVNPEEIRESKQVVHSDNFDFILYLKRYVDSKL